MADFGLGHVDWDAVDVATVGMTTGELEVSFEGPFDAPSAVVVPFAPEWPQPAPRFLGGVRPEPPALPLQVFPTRLAEWVVQAAESKGAPLDYVASSMLAVAASLIGNSRWVSPWQGWAEPPVLNVMIVGQPSAGKSPALDAVLSPLREIEKAEGRKIEAEIADWEEKAGVASLAESAWKEMTKKEIKDGETPPEKPDEMVIPPKPQLPRLVVNDATIERLGVILAGQPRGTLQVRDELAGFLEGMNRYSSGSDRPFWLEAYGGRSYTVERMAREPLTVDHLTIGIVGGIQPDRLKTLLFGSDDDGLLARFIPIWPEPAPIKRPLSWGDDSFIARVFDRLYALEMYKDENGELRPFLVHFTDEAQAVLDQFRQAIRNEEADTEGLLLSFLGKLPGMAVRLSLVLAALDYATGEDDALAAIEVSQFIRAAQLVWTYILPMARRAYADAGYSAEERKAFRLVEYFRESRVPTFTTREITRAGIAGVRKIGDLNPVLALLEDGDVIKTVAATPGAVGGRPKRCYAVNPALLAG